MTWRVDDGLPPDDLNTDPAHYAETLVIDDTGEEVGGILQFTSRSPFYGFAHGKGRTGPMTDLTQCRERVERLAFGIVR